MDPDDTRVTVSIHQETRDNLDNQPKAQALMMSDPQGRVLLCDFDGDGAALLRLLVNGEVKQMYLHANLFSHLVMAGESWLSDIDEWQEDQALKQRQTLPPASAPDPFDVLVNQYRGGLLGKRELLYALNALEVAKIEADAAQDEPEIPADSPYGDPVSFI